MIQVEEASKALEATNGTTLEKNGQLLRVAYAKSILGPGSGTSQASSLAAAAIEAATFSQQVFFPFNLAIVLFFVIILRAGSCRYLCRMEIMFFFIMFRWI